MTKNITLNSKKRDENEKANKVKDAGDIPAVVYGPGYENKSLKIDLVEFEKAYSAAGTSTMIGLKIDDSESIQVIIKDVQTNHKNNVVHVDFYKIDESKKMSAPITLNFVGESEAVEVKKGVLSKNIDFIEVECLPSELVSHIDVDLTQLKEIGDSITIKDLALPETFTIKNNDTDSVASVIEPQKEVAPEPSPEKEESADDAKKDDKGEEKSGEKDGEKKEEQK